MKLSPPSLAFNPVLVKELRGRMRGPRAFLFLTGVLVLLGLVSYGLFQLAMPRYSGVFQPNVAAGAMIGQTVFVGLVFLTLLLICAIAPSLTAGAISNEHQHKTFDLLMATPLAPITILAGKLGAALSYVVLILLAAIPITSLAYVFGGVTPSDLIKAFVVMGGFALAYGVIGLFFSALFNRTGLAVGASYFLIGFFILGTLFIYLVVGVMRGEQPSNWLLALNPFSALASALIDGVVTDQNNVYNGSAMTPVLWGLSGGRFDNSQVTQVPLWQYTLGVYAWLTLILFALTTQLIKPMQRFRTRFWIWLGVGLVGLAIGAALVVWSSPTMFAPVRSALRWQFNTERDVVVNGNFDAPLAPVWRSDVTMIGMSDSAGKHALRISGPSGAELNTQHVRQALDVPLPDTGMVRVRMTFRLDAHETLVCGPRGEYCPLTLKLGYTDGTGRKHEWAQGFYASGVPNGRQGLPPRCRRCEIRPNHIRVPEEQWYTFESGDLFEANMGSDAPRSLDEVTLGTAGTGYVTEVAQVSVFLHEGRPLFYGKQGQNNYRWSPSVLLPWWISSAFNSNSGGGAVFPGGPIRQGGIIPMIQRPPVMVPPPVRVITATPAPVPQSTP